MAHQVPARLTTRERRKFGLAVGIAFLVFAGISRWRGHDVAPLILASIGGALVVAGLVLPQILGPVYRWWMGLARVLSKVTTPIFMGIVYFLVLTPIGILRRVFGSTPVDAKARNGSYWMAHQSASEGSMTRQF
ncbi:MAG: SxtJ family membrane protein [Gemmatimonadaceae bacterium]